MQAKMKRDIISAPRLIAMPIIQLIGHFASVTHSRPSQWEMLTLLGGEFRPDSLCTRSVSELA